MGANDQGANTWKVATKTQRTGSSKLETGTRVKSWDPKGKDWEPRAESHFRFAISASAQKNVFFKTLVFPQLGFALRGPYFFMQRIAVLGADAP